jgi:hypothetical protein
MRGRDLTRLARVLPAASSRAVRARASHSRRRSYGLRALSWRRRPAAAPALQELLAQRGLGARQQVGSRQVAPARRVPQVVAVRQLEIQQHVAKRREPQVVAVRQLEIQQLVAKRQHGGAGGESRRENERGDESRREDDSVVPELDASRHCGGDPHGDLGNELVDAKAVSHEVLDVRADVVVGEVQARERRVVVQGRRERPRAFSADVVVGKVQAREGRVVVEGCRERPRALPVVILRSKIGRDELSC